MINTKLLSYALRSYNNNTLFI